MLFAARPAAADTITQIGPARTGRLQFVMVGASLVDNTGLANGVNCLKTSAAAEILAADLPARPLLVQATLYVGGSLIGDDGPDTSDPPQEIFATPGLEANDPLERALVEAAARAAADREVSLLAPAALAPASLSAASSYVAVTYIPSGSEQGNLGFFITRFDVTQVLRDAGGLAGQYLVSGLTADVCNGPEAVCDTATNTCALAGGAPHTHGAASFALVLVVEDLELPLRSLAVFEGLEMVVGFPSQPPLILSLMPANPISSPARGGLALYALEGDLGIPAIVNAVGPCLAEEHLEVDGDLDPTQNGYCLSDDDNPLGNLFNSTINVQPAPAPPPACNEPPERQQLCCLGDGLCGVTGVDIDRFDISPALEPGALEVQVRLGSGSDRVALAQLVLAVDVFEPVLAVDTQVRVLDAQDDLVAVGAPITYSIAVSNTGNVRATAASVRFAAPVLTRGLRILARPAGAVESVLATGGDFGTGEALVSNFAVAAGEIAEVRVQVVSVCEALLRTLQPAVEVASAELAPFAVPAPQIVARGPGQGACTGIEPDGPLREPTPPRRLTGGGGCSQSRAPLLLALWVVLVLTQRRNGRIRGPAHKGIFMGSWVAALLLVGLGVACAERHENPPAPPAPSTAITDLAALPGEPCGSLLRVWVTRDDNTRFCIDRFEASVTSASLGDAHQGAGDADTATNGTTQAAAGVALAVAPAAGLSWYQAKAAC
ncbi:MAG: hypothetical protein HYZ27_07700, partial [Deltaproteobacteria bacterium]|nr:hypothetical protein [Deltaproteobacteria bacterium]